MKGNGALTRGGGAGQPRICEGKRGCHFYAPRNASAAAVKEHAATIFPKVAAAVAAPPAPRSYCLPGTCQLAAARGTGQHPHGKG
jgi:hypothetical protein